MTEQNQEQNQPKSAKRSQGLLAKATIVGVVSGLLGGGLSYVGLNQVNQTNSTVPQATVSSTSSGKTTNTSANSGAMTSAFHQVNRAVVSVVNLKREKSSGNSEDSLFGEDDSSSSSKKSSDLETYSEGSGVIYMKANGKGYLVTNNHVVSGSDELRVILSNGKKVTAKLVGTDSVTDLAVLTIDAKYVTKTAEFGNSKNLQPGQTVIAVGSPLGSEYATSVTQGIISATNRTLNVTNSQGQITNQATVIQTDAAINPGNSGGPLVNASGQVIGINSMKLTQSNDGTSVEGMGFAIPSDEVVVIINQLVKNGKISRPQLGIRVASVSELSSYGRQTLKLPEEVTYGVYVASVVSGSSAANAGIKKNDVIVKADGQKVSDVVALHTILYAHKSGDHISIQVVRNGHRRNLTATLK